MSFIDRLWVALISIPAEMFERAFWYVVLAGLAWLVLYVFPARWLARRRIHAKPTTARQMGRELLYSARSVVVYGVVGGFMIFAIVSGWTPMYFRIERFGWTWFFASIAITILVHDTYFYWTHRLMHHPRLFRAMHRTHHLSTNPSPWAAYSFSTGEAFVQAGIAPLVIFTLPLHPLAFTLFMVWQTSFNVLGHCGYELFPRWFVNSWCGWILNTSTHHAQHHETNRANFSLYFNFWDRLLGTNHAHYPERFEEAAGSVETDGSPPPISSAPRERHGASRRIHVGSANPTTTGG